MTEWVEHDGGPQPVAGDVWVEVLYSGSAAGRIARAGNHMALVWKGQRFKWRILNQNTMASLIDAALKRGIELGLEASNKAIGALYANDVTDRQMALEDASMTVCALDPDTIAREAINKETAR